MSLPLEFDVSIVPLVPQAEGGIFNCGDSFDLRIRISTKNGSSFSHKGIHFYFTSILVPNTGKPINLTTPLHIQISESSSINPMFECNMPQLTIPANIQTYHGELFSVKHMLQFVVKKSFGSVEYSEEIKAFSYAPCVSKLQPLCVRVAVTENVRIDLVINRRKFELRDVILGGAHFLLVALKITKFEVSLVAQEVMEVSGKPVKHKNTINTWGVTDGAPVKGEIIPFRLYLSPLNLTPSVVDQTKGFSVSHFLYFTIFTTSGQKYYKSLQIKLGKWTSMPFAYTDG